MLFKKLIEIRRADAELPPEIRAALVRSLFAPISSLTVGAINCSIIGRVVALAPQMPHVTPAEAVVHA